MGKIRGGEVVDFMRKEGRGIKRNQGSGSKEERGEESEGNKGKRMRRLEVVTVRGRK